MLRSWALKAPPRPADFVQRWSAWTTAFGGANKTKGNPVLAVSNDIGAREYGYAAGVDYRLKPQSTVGFAMADGATNRGLAQGFGGNSDAFQVGAYGICLANHWMLAGAAISSATSTACFEPESCSTRSLAPPRRRLISILSGESAQPGAPPNPFS